MKSDEEYATILLRLKELEEVMPLSGTQSFAMYRIRNYLDAKRLGLKYFHYAGVTYEDSKPFCKERCGKIFSIDEMFDWINSKDRPKGINYDPLMDMGGNKCIEGSSFCNHGMNFISDSMAKKQRPDIVLENKTVERPDYSKLDPESRVTIENRIKAVAKQFTGPKVMIVQATFDKFVRDFIADNKITFNDALISLNEALDLIENNLIEKLSEITLPELKITDDNNSKK